MSDSDDEFGSLAPTTPLVPVRKRSRTAEGRPVAGPSKLANKPSKGRPKNTKKPQEYTKTRNVVDPIHVSTDAEGEDDEIVEVAPAKKSKGSNASTRSESVLRNGVTIAKGKERAKADPPQPTGRSSRKAAQASEPTVGSDDVELIEDTEPEPPNPHGAHSSKIAGKGKRTAPSSSLSPKADISTRELERLRQRLEDAEGHRETLRQQLEELFRVRNTEAEKLLEQQEVQYKARIQTQDTLIKELTAQAARAEPLTRSGKGSVLHLVTREAADAEKRTVEKDLERLQSLFREKDDIIAENERQIIELQQSVNDLRFELQAEIDRNRQMANTSRKAPPQSSHGSTHNAILGSDSPKNTEVIKLYEDLTNFLVPSLRFMPGKYGQFEETVCTCIYTHMDPAIAALEENVQNGGKSLSFTLRLYTDLDEDSDSGDQQRPMVGYTPLELDKESPEFIGQLDFLATSFNFERDQLPMFLSSLQKNMGIAATQVEGYDDVEEMEEMEV